MIKEHDCVVLTTNVPEEGLEAGDVGTVVHMHKGGMPKPSSSLGTASGSTALTLASLTVTALATAPASAMALAICSLAHACQGLCASRASMMTLVSNNTARYCSLIRTDQTCS